MTTLPLLRQRSREASLHGNATPSGSRRSEALAQCASARSAKDIEGCLLAARAALKQEASCGKAWAFLCWSLFELRRYEEARAECLRALSHRAWPTRDREGMAALLTSCRLLSELTPAMGERLRDGWYQKRLRALYDAGGLYEYELCEQDVWGFQRRKGVGRNELSLSSTTCRREECETCAAAGGERNIPAGLLVGGDPSNVRHPHAACFGGPNFPVEQALGGVVYLNSAILSFHCDKRFGPERDVQAPRRLECYDGNGPCRSCMRNGLPVPTHRFPEWTALAPGATIVQPHAGMDVFYSTDAVAPRLHQQLSSQLDALARKGGTRPMPKYHNVIDPNLNAVDGLWVPSEFDVVEKTTAPIELAIAVELACLAATGHRLPFGFGHDIAKLASLTEGVQHADCAMRSTIPDLEPHAHAKLHVATQKLMGAALPMLAKLRRPALLLPGPLQAVVKAQRIVLAEGEDYAGVWHEDGMDEHVVAVVLYYHRASPTLKGGSLEFCSKQTQALWCGDAGGAHGNVDNAAELAASLPRCQVPVREGTLVCFSNYAAVHRVLRMEAADGDGSRDFMAFFIIDQRHPLPTPRSLPPLPERTEACKALLVQQLQPRGTFGFDNSNVYSTGNGSVADVGWVRNAGGTRVEDTYPDAATLIDRLNLEPPRVDRGVSMVLQGPRPRADEAVSYTAESSWAEAWIGEGDNACFLYIDMTYAHAVSDAVPEEGVSEVKCFPRGMEEFAEFLDHHGFWVAGDNWVLKARLEGRAVELVVDGLSYWATCEQLQPIRKLRSLAEGSRCEVSSFLAEFNDEEEVRVADDANSLPFQAEACPGVLRLHR